MAFDKGSGPLINNGLTLILLARGGGGAVEDEAKHLKFLCVVLGVGDPRYYYGPLV